MTESTPQPETRRARSKSKSDGAAWKSGLLVAGISAVVFGSALLIKENAASEAQATAIVSAERSLPATSVELAPEAPVAPSLRSGDTGIRRSRLQQPGFQRPLTRSRGS